MGTELATCIDKLMKAVSNAHLNEQSEHNAGLQEGKVLAQAVSRSLYKGDKLHTASTQSIESNCVADIGLSSNHRRCNVSNQPKMGCFQGFEEAISP